MRTTPGVWCSTTSAAGIDPAKSTIFLQSAIHETYELALLLGNLVTVPRLARVPSIKDMARAAMIDVEAIPFGLLGYPVLQAADILLPRANLVPVGKDNQAHVEITREIARRFNNLYGEVFPIPDDLVEGDTLPGTDGQAKMSKSIGNAIFLNDDAATVRKKVHSMYTDPNRIRADIPGTVEGNPVFTYLDHFDPDKPLDRRTQDPLPGRNGRRRGGQGAAGAVAERVPRANARAGRAVRGPERPGRRDHLPGHDALPRDRRRDDARGEEGNGAVEHASTASRGRPRNGRRSWRSRARAAADRAGRPRNPCRHCPLRGPLRRPARCPVANGAAQPGEHFRPLDDLRISSIGFGLASGDPTDEIDARYQQAVAAAVAGGCNHFDVALSYRGQRSEVALGRALAELVAAGALQRDEVIVASKAGFIPYPPDEDDTARYVYENFIAAGIAEPDDFAGGIHCMAPNFLSQQIAWSLRNLGLRPVDIYYLQNPETQLPFADRDHVSAPAATGVCQAGRGSGCRAASVVTASRRGRASASHR